VEYLTPGSFINPLPGCVEDKAGDAKSDSGRDKRGSFIFQECLVCRNPVIQQGLFCGLQHQLISYVNEFTVRWRLGFDWKKRS
jgi:hypothetical protein